MRMITKIATTVPIPMYILLPFQEPSTNQYPG